MTGFAAPDLRRAPRGANQPYSRSSQGFVWRPHCATFHMIDAFMPSKHLHTQGPRAHPSCSFVDALLIDFRLHELKGLDQWHGLMV